MSLCPSNNPISIKKLLVSSVHLQPQMMSVPTHCSMPKTPATVPSPPSEEMAPPKDESTPEPKAEEEQESVEVSETSTEKPAPKKAPPKAPPKTTPSKATKTPVKKSPSKPTKKPINPTAKKTAPTKNPSSSQSKNNGVDQKLLQKVLKSLNQSKAYGERTQKGGGGNASGEMRRAGAVGSLAVDKGVAVEGIRDDFAESGFGESSPEACYIADLIRRLQLNIRLPEPGEVRLKLTLKRNGSMTNISFVRCQKESTKKAIKEKLSSILFAPFGSSFSSEPEHIFMLRLTHDLVWSYGS